MNNEAHNPQPADSHGAVDLSAAAARGNSSGGVQPAAQGNPAKQAPTSQRVTGLDIPLVDTCDDSTFEAVAARSQQVPVVIVLWAAQSLESKQLLATLEELARDKMGAFQLVEIDVARAPRVAQAFQVQVIPTVVALVGARPVPLFQGVAPKEQIAPVIEDLLRAAQQMGVTGRVAVSGQDVAKPIPEEHLPALEAEERGDLEGARAAWDKIIELNPRDEDAKDHRARVNLRLRESSASDDPSARADALFAAGQHAEAFEVLLQLMEDASEEEKEDYRVRLLDLFRIAGSTPEVKAARRRLSSLLMI